MARHKLILSSVIEPMFVTHATARVEWDSLFIAYVVFSSTAWRPAPPGKVILARLLLCDISRFLTSFKQPSFTRGFSVLICVISTTFVLHKAVEVVVTRLSYDTKERCGYYELLCGHKRAPCCIGK